MHAPDCISWPLYSPLLPRTLELGLIKGLTPQASQMPKWPTNTQVHAVLKSKTMVC